MKRNSLLFFAAFLVLCLAHAFAAAPTLKQETPPTTKKKEPPASSRKDTRDDKTKAIEAHNEYRKKHGAEPLVWNDEMADFAEEHTKVCDFKHSTADWGENIAEGYEDVNDAFNAWYDEVNIYKAGKEDFDMKTAHFTQMVWKGTKEFGCYSRKCPRGYYLVCEYNPAGNIKGENGKHFKENVQP
ncbi:CAP domain-containing protein [Myxococcus sp. K15C18031901]|uniref:CAP domain-containing protein n=1 Tax=Myxococcus dinghuensis TaxID=2906761 RepID=UPI0020A81A51|nr:CAP domain-containing protein [Myxococcus dinghuensis]MCP3104229.1 CAP domain-containing protein [Myxococcus dinghuensis]